MYKYVLNWFRLTYIDAKYLIYKNRVYVHVYVTHKNAFFRVSRPSRRNLVCWLHNPSYANSEDTGGAGESMQLLLDRGRTWYLVPGTLEGAVIAPSARFFGLQVQPTVGVGWLLIHVRPFKYI